MDGCLVGFSTQCSIDPVHYWCACRRRTAPTRSPRRASTLVVHMLHDDGATDRSLASSVSKPRVTSTSSRGATGSPDPTGFPCDPVVRLVRGHIVGRVNLGDHVGFAIDVQYGARFAPPSPTSAHRRPRPRSREPGLRTATMCESGTSGWHYQDWRGAFYPQKLPARRWLDYYAARFETVELNNTFYRLRNSARFASWKAQTPATSSSRSRPAGSYALPPAPRPGGARRAPARAAGALDEKLGPVLLQLPPNLGVDVLALARALDAFGGRVASGV
jgi:hypothetical protein